MQNSKNCFWKLNLCNTFLAGNYVCYYRFMWFVCVAVGAVATMIIIVSLWEKFQTNPTITGLDTDFHNWDVPFPAITVCLQDPSNDSTIEQYIQK